MRILVTGPQGSGKTTQAQILAEKFGLCFVDPGEMMRALSKENSPQGKDVKADLSTGDLVDNQIVAKAVKDKLSQPVCNGGFVMDAYPRSLGQLKFYDPHYDQVFFLKLTEAEVRARLLKRGREDDTPNLIDERLKHYYAETQPVIDFFRELGKLVEINASGSIEETAEKIIDSLIFEEKLIKEESDLELLRLSGVISAKVLKEVMAAVKVGVSLIELDKIAERGFKKHQASASFKTVPGYNFSSCLTVNSEVVHGLPRDIKLKAGDLLAIDLGAVYQSWHTDLAWTVVVGGEGSELQKKFLATGEAALWKATEEAVEGKKIGDISHAIQSIVEEAGYNVIRSLAGHGVGRQGHEKPEVPTFGRKGAGLELKAGMVLAIEAIYTNGSGEVFTYEDGWTIATTDRGWGGLFEMSVIVGKTKPEIITDFKQL